MSYVRNSVNSVNQQIAAITSVDVTSQTAEAMLRDGSSQTIHTDHFVGAIDVTPSIGDQWIIENGVGGWKLVQRLPFNDPPATAIERTQGQARIGSGRGPVELAGTSVNAYGPLRLHTTDSSTRPSATEAGAGATIFDTTLGKPIFSTGSAWVDSSGTPV